MSFLYSNDTIGTYPNSWYAATSTPAPLRPALTGTMQADVCIIGAGFTGLSCALHLAQRGYSVALLEAHRVGFGASGRNGGQVGSGLNTAQSKLVKMMGADKARHLWDITQDAKSLVQSIITEQAPDAGFHAGVAHANFWHSDNTDTKREADFLNTEYGYDEIEILDEARIQNVIKSSKYKGGQIDWGAAHTHPLRYAFGLARAAEAGGAQIFEQSAVINVTPTAKGYDVQTAAGNAKCTYVIHATNGYHNGLNPAQSARVMPINNYLVATVPLDNAADVLTKNIAVADNRFVLNYYRLSHDNRLIFGGGESYGAKLPNDIFAKVRKPLRQLFPQLADLELTHAWGGTLGITPTRLPLFSRIRKNEFTAAGYSGHGVALASFAGKVMAEVIGGQSEKFDLLSQLPIPIFPGGQRFRTPIMTLAMTWFALRDKIGL